MIGEGARNQMRDFESKAYSIYGASMGRGNNTELTGKVSLVRVRLDSGGYDKGGAYWGAGIPLYCATDAHGCVRYMRSVSRESAKKALLGTFPAVKFYRLNP
jgi:hypothetical protein